VIKIAILRPVLPSRKYAIAIAQTANIAYTMMYAKVSAMPCELAKYTDDSAKHGNATEATAIAGIPIRYFLILILRSFLSPRLRSVCPPGSAVFVNSHNPFYL
jgi:hypothetical protein